MEFPDLFTGNAFSMVSLTHAINEEAYLPGQASSLGIFEESGVPVTTMLIDRKADSIALVPATQRGGPGVQNKTDGKSVVSLQIPHFQQDDSIKADEVQGVREFGSGDQMRTIQSLVAEKNRRMARNLDLTSEFQRFGALKGKVYDADGTTLLFDYFVEMGEAEPSAIDFDLDAASPASGVLRQKCSDVIRAITVALGGIPYRYIHGLCGSTFFDQFQAHAEYREVHLNAPSNTVLRQGVPYTQLQFGGLTLEEYRGPSTGPAFIGAGEAWFFPVGVPGLFISRFAPADYMETVNTIGLPRYARLFPDPVHPLKSMKLETQTNPIHACTRPRVLRKGTNT